MSTFSYSAMDGNGQATTGTIEAASRQAAIATLAQRRIFVTQVAEGGEGRGTRGEYQPLRSKTRSGAAWRDEGRESSNVKRGGLSVGREKRSTLNALRSTAARVKLRYLAMLWRQLATALEAGLPLLTSLQVVRDQSEHPPLRALLEDLAHRVEGGEALSDAMEDHGRTFSPLHVSMVRAGETAGVLDQVMNSLADFAQRDLATREQVRSASVYPIIILVLAAASIIVILTFILPRVMQTIGGAVNIMPLPTRILMGTSDALRSYGWLMLIVLALGVWAFRSWTATPEGRYLFDAFKLRVPLLGKTLRQIAVARFARALGTLTKAGIQIVEALGVLRDTLGNEVMGRTIDEVRSAVIQGKPIAEPLEESGEFPAMFVQVVSLGEKTGRLDKLLLQAADSFDKETATAIQRTMTVLPALFIVALALVVGFILAAVLLPIINMQTAIPGM